MRIIGKIEIKDKYVIKPIQFEGLRKIGNPEDIINRFYNDNFDEILIYNVTGSLYGIGWIKKFVERVLKKTFVPVTIGGGIQNLDQAKEFFDVGVDKISVNTSIINDFSLVEKLKKEFGCQSVVCSIQANKINNEWYGFTEMARTKTKIKVEDLIKRYNETQVGEILLTSVRRDGTMEGIDEELLNLSLKYDKVPIIHSGGVKLDDAKKLKNYAIDAITVSSSYYYKNFKPKEFKKNLKSNDI